MQSVSQELIDTLEFNTSLGITTNVVGEWELNSYNEPTVTAPASTDDELFPADDIALPRRPESSGLPKVVTGNSRITAEDTYPKYRVPSETMNYRYYHTDEVSAGDNTIGPVQIDIEYAQAVKCNKIVVGFEVSYTAPVDAELFITENGTDWTSIGTFSPNVEGRINAYRQDGGSWNTIEVNKLENALDIFGVRVVVSALTTAGDGLSVIQISPRIAVDLSDRVIDVSINKQAMDMTMSNPIGTAIASTASIELANDDRLFDQENSESALYGLIDRNVRFNVYDVVIRNDGVSEQVAQGVFFADTWNVDGTSKATAETTDRSKFLQETIIENSFYVGKSAEQIIPDIVERFGHTKYDINVASEDADQRIPYTFFKNEQTVWQALTSLAVAEQAVFYFNEQDTFVWESRDYVWNHTAVDQELRDVSVVDQATEQVYLPNLIDFSPGFEVATNKVIVKYTPLAPARSASTGQLINNVAWEHSEDLVLESTYLIRRLDATDNIIRISKDDWPFWPLRGIVNIGGEYISFTKSQTSGNLNIVERGLYGSDIKTHEIDPSINGWEFSTMHWNGSNWVKTSGNSGRGRHLIRNSFVQIYSGRNNNRERSQYLAGTTTDNYSLYGCEVVFPGKRDTNGNLKYYGNGVAGLMIHSDGDFNGYHIELMLSSYARKFKNTRAELRIFKFSGGNGRYIWVSTPSVGKSTGGTGKAFDIVPGKRYRLEVFYNRIDNDNQFTVYLDGRPVLTATHNDQNLGTGRTRGKWGVYTRGNTIARFESVWTVNSNQDVNDLEDWMQPITDRINGGFVSENLEQLWRKKYRSRIEFNFEDFGAWAHQGQEFDVDYEVAPNVGSDLFFSNDNEIFNVYHNRDPFSSRFLLMNKARGPAVLVGQDASRDDQNMSLFVYGKPIIEQAESNVTRKDDLSIRNRGVEEFEISSPWIQTEERANRIADWLIDRWGKPNDIVDASIIVYPHLQVGDLVQIRAPSDHLEPSTHKYHIVSISKTVGSSHSMNLQLRRTRV